MRPTLSVIIPTKDRLAYLQEAVASLQGLETGWEAIIVDDGSTDGTSTWLSSVSDERIRTIRMETSVERSAARNAGLETALGTYVVFLDDDDRIRPSGAAELIRALDADPTGIAAVGGQIAFDESGHTRTVPHPRSLQRVWIWKDVLAGWNRPPGQWMMRSEAVRAAGGWNEDLIAGEDGDMWLRIGRSGPVILHPAVLLEKRVHEGRWRPPDVGRTATEYRLDFIARLPAAEQGASCRFVAARSLRTRAQQAWSQGAFDEALRDLGAAVVVAPRLFLSPATRSEFSVQLAKAVVGRVLGRNVSGGLSQVSRSVRTLLGKNPGRGRPIQTVAGSAKRSQDAADTAIKP